MSTVAKPKIVPHKIYPLKINNDDLIASQKPSIIEAIKSSGKIVLPVPSGFQCCLPEEILYLKAESNYTEIHYKNGDKLLLSKTLRWCEQFLPDHLFFRVHRSYMVNAAHINHINNSTKSSFIHLINDVVLPISRNHKSDFRLGNKYIKI